LIGNVIKTIFFDIGGVLIDIHPGHTYQYISDCVDIDKSIIEKRFPWQPHNEYEKGIINDREWFFAVKESLPEPCCLKESDFWKAWRLLLGKEKQTRNILRDLRGKYRLWLLSNTNPRHIQDEIEKKYLFPKLIDGAIYSFEVGVRKPDKAIYKIAMKKANVNKAHESLFIDDLYENVRAAKNIGMNSIHFKSTQQLKEELFDLGIDL
tara:strand:- start:10 stop:633 length:624 start_codon:yes stop_codon:yes gene_type:complete